MSKKSLERQLGATEAKAVIRHLRVSPRKLNLVAGIIRGLDVSSALTQLAFSSKRIANDVRRGLQSAIANAENNHNLNVDSLYVKEAYIGKNLVMKRMHTRGRGKSARILKPFSNLTLIVGERGEALKLAPKAKKEKARPKKISKETPQHAQGDKKKKESK
ncbi:MAG: 50S ribosomal protein L22 [Pseudomonadota bacterium]|nr:50S ribosomal protein L22 [Pseudomonadota bacterium]MDE3037860.1 50S ribosomal protein L22 [Pseudomonadota bacterium]